MEALTADTSENKMQEMICFCYHSGIIHQESASMQLVSKALTADTKKNDANFTCVCGQGGIVNERFSSTQLCE